MFLFSRGNQSISALSAEELKKRVADMVIKLRKEKGYTQSDMALKFSMSQFAYSKIESCKTDINLEKLFLFCEILEITLTELLGLDHVISVAEHGLVSELEGRLIQCQNTVNEKNMMISLLIGKLKDNGINID